MDLSSSSHEATPAEFAPVQEALGALWIALDAIPDPLHRLDALRAAMHGVTGEVSRTVDACREVNVPWQLIADALGMNSRQAAQARYGA